ncbi:MAG: gephyrin-like molybdotransferase Glp [Paracoccaceae bacterium]
MLMPVAEALSRILALAPRMGTERVPLAAAEGRVLAEDAIARRAQPPFAASAMDGYAVRATEASPGAALRLAGVSQAGRAHGEALPEGAAVRIFTGAPLPDGADAILIQEDAEASGGTVRVREAPAAGAHIRPVGGDFQPGDRLTAPIRLAPRHLTLLAAMNLADVTVSRRPLIALIPTGDELVEPGQSPGPDQIVSSNGAGLMALVRAAGAEARLCPIARDTPESLRAALAVARGADLIVTIGGASVGEHDLVAAVLGSEGLALDLYKVAMRPGKPLMAGRIGGAAMIGLPGNPVSAMVCGEIFLRPAIEAALGLPSGPRARIPARLAHDLGPNGPREHYMRAQRLDGDRVRVFERQDSSLMAVLAAADCLVVRPPGTTALAAGAPVDIVPLTG